MPLGTKGEAAPKTMQQGDPPAVDPRAGLVAKAEANRAATLAHAAKLKAKPLAEVLVDVAKRHTHLDLLDTQVTAVIPRVEDVLRKHISVRVSTVMNQDDTWLQELVFGKWDGKWQLLVESGTVDDPEGFKTVPLVTCPRETRTAVFTGGFVDTLVRGVLGQLDARIREREHALANAHDLIAQLDAAANPNAVIAAALAGTVNK